MDIDPKTEPGQQGEPGTTPEPDAGKGEPSAPKPDPAPQGVAELSIDQIVAANSSVAKMLADNEKLLKDNKKYRDDRASNQQTEQDRLKAEGEYKKLVESLETQATELTTKLTETAAERDTLTSKLGESSPYLDYVNSDVEKIVKDLEKNDPKVQEKLSAIPGWSEANTALGKLKILNYYKNDVLTGTTSTKPQPHGHPAPSGGPKPPGEGASPLEKSGYAYAQKVASSRS